MIYTKQETSGEWLDKKTVTSGTIVKIVAETKIVDREFEGKINKQNITKVQIGKDIKNMSLNKSTINGLVSAFGNESKNWINKEATLIIESSVIGGKRVKIAYLVPNGYQLAEDDNGYLIISKTGGEEIPVIEDDIPVIEDEI
jgi:hypothetical protein